MALFEATYSLIIIQNSAVSQGQSLCFWWWKELGLVWKEEFSTPRQRARVRPDHMQPHGQGCSIQATPQFSSRSWGQVNGHWLLTTACHQQLISQACKWAATDLPIFSPEMLTGVKQETPTVSWTSLEKLIYDQKLSQSQAKTVCYDLPKDAFDTQQALPCAFKNHSRTSKIK